MSSVTVKQILEDRQKYHNPELKHEGFGTFGDGQFICVGCHWCSPANIKEDKAKYDEAQEIIDLTERWNASARDKQTYSLFGYYSTKEDEF